MSKLRLVLTLHCNRDCAGCCNKQWNWDEVPVFDGDYTKYDEVLLTGGEPMLYPSRIWQEICNIRKSSPDTRIILYTAKPEQTSEFLVILEAIDGLTITLHDQSDVVPFREFDEWMQYELSSISDKTLRVNVFKEAGWFIPPPDWIVKQDMEWIENCPLPVGEVLMKHPDYLK